MIPEEIFTHIADDDTKTILTKLPVISDFQVELEKLCWR